MINMLSRIDPAIPNEPGRNWPSLDALWERAKLLFARFRGELYILGGNMPVASRFLRPRDARDILNWMEPIEQLVRACLIMRAIDWLKSTAEGLALLASPRTSPAERARPLRADPAEPAQSEPAAPETNEPDQPAEPVSDAPPAFNARAWVREGWVVEITELGARAAAMPREPQPPPLGRTERRAKRLAAHIALLSSIIDDPTEAIHGIARVLARLTPRRIIPWSHGFIPTRPEWMHGGPSVKAARSRLIDTLEAWVEPRPG